MTLRPIEEVAKDLMMWTHSSEFNETEQEEIIKSTLTARDAEWEERMRPYYELLDAVENKYEGETRHQTALRFIRTMQGGTSEATRNNPPTT